ncbi:hypothetical protein LV779_08645 [Streptomyces thinghirensis]|nr:hypothetical protein [Streptomyces thinghirensis]
MDRVARSQAVLMEGDVDDAAGVGITVEPAGGSGAADQHADRADEHARVNRVGARVAPTLRGPLRIRRGGRGRSRWCVPRTPPSRGGRPCAVPAAASRCRRSAGTS